MIPTNWREHRRDDGEIIGYVATCDDGYAAHTLIGYPLVAGVDEEDATQALDAAGLRYLAEGWLLTIDDREHPISVQIVEASPTAVTVQNVDPGYEGEWGMRFTLEVPVGSEQLRPRHRLNGRQ